MLETSLALTNPLTQELAKVVKVQMTGRAVVRRKGKRLGTREDVREPQFRNRHGLRAAISQQLENLLEIRIGSEELLTREQVVGFPQVSPAQHAREVGSARRGNRTPQKLLKLEVLRRLAKVFRKSRPVDRLLEVHIWAQCCECPHVVRSVDGSNGSTINRLESVEQSPQVALVQPLQRSMSSVLEQGLKRLVGEPAVSGSDWQGVLVEGVEVLAGDAPLEPPSSACFVAARWMYADGGEREPDI
eukprot:CAMPEP_0183590938 /NCGR_PEP_ID=MMETSP0371-20130417/165358_1 /TAXON_ID=268820 /ORGANISM="Peridinium aciculiferum, Strain PAER-2" /LENGTH=244 /DNA_ID=CAMNT_0025802377 /DNA_START=16 /DNA_END=751 /DNA_ORIENTATION=+